jgi:hypothetical protein
MHTQKGRLRPFCFIQHTNFYVNKIASPYILVKSRFRGKISTYC